MRRINYKKNLSISIILLLILVIGIGYAYLTSNLSISGTTEIAGNSWDIHFENLNVKDGSVTATTPATISNSTTDITYSIKLERPKDFYEFTVDVKNDGTLPGKVSISSLAGITTEAAPIVGYTITYINGKSVNVGDILNAGAKKSIRVRVFYKDDISATDLPNSNLNLTLTYTLQYIQSDDMEVNAGNLIQNLASTNTCITKYEGNVTDQVGVTVPATNVYFDKCVDKRHILFAGFCWQVIRTTENGDMKLLYNGVPKYENKCTTMNPNSSFPYRNDSNSYDYGFTNYLFGKNFIFDYSSKQYIVKDLVDPPTSWKDIKEYYTCKSSSNICSTLYIADTTSYNYLSLGKSGSNDTYIATMDYNIIKNRLYASGYMYNRVGDYNNTYPTASEYKYGSTFIYDENTNMYTLSGITKSLSDWSTVYNQINNTHYTCWNTSGVCEELSYIYYTSNTVARNIILKKGNTLDDILDETLFDKNTNEQSSTVKLIIDSWYKEYLLSYADKIGDVVYCNNRTVSNLGGWNPNGGDVTQALVFNNNTSFTDLSCSQKTDQFAVINNKAKLMYPIALLTSNEYANIFDGSYTLKDMNLSWTISPYKFEGSDVLFIRLGSNGLGIFGNSSGSTRVVPAIAITSDAVITGGTGSETDPWIVE